MEPLFPVIPPSVCLNKSLRIGKARDDIKEVDAMPSHIALPLGLIPFIPHILLYAHIVCTCQGWSRACLSPHKGQEQRQSRRAHTAPGVGRIATGADARQPSVFRSEGWAIGRECSRCRWVSRRRCTGAIGVGRASAWYAFVRSIHTRSWLHHDPVCYIRTHGTRRQL